MFIILTFLLSNIVLADGKQLYTSKCVRCHNVDPTKPGSIGPDIADSTLELLKLKTQLRSYPQGYTPKRKTKIMPIIKLSDVELISLYEYIRSFLLRVRNL